jgi:predicted transcriptional regulator
MSEMVSLDRKEFEGMKKEIAVIRESLEVLLDREYMDSAKRGLEDITAGRVLSHEAVKKKFSC